MLTSSRVQKTPTRDTYPLSISTFLSILHLEGNIAREQSINTYTYKCLLSSISKESQCVFNKSVFLISLVSFFRIALRLRLYKSHFIRPPV